MIEKMESDFLQRKVKSYNYCDKKKTQKHPKQDMRLKFLHIVHTMSLDAVRAADKQFACFIFVNENVFYLRLLHFECDCECYAANYCEASLVSNYRLKFDSVSFETHTTIALVRQIEPSAELLNNLAHTHTKW